MTHIKDQQHHNSAGILWSEKRVMEPSLAKKLWAQAQRKAFQCLYHPFVASLAAGTLAKTDFQAFLLQDAYFLNAFAQAFAYAVTKTSTSHHTLAIVRRMGGIEQELRTHSAFLESFGIDVFAVTHASAAPATNDYVNFLLSTAKRSESVSGILAAMTPCMRLYAFLGQRIAAAARAIETRELNPYQKWIDSYSPDEFNEAANGAEDLLDELATHENVSYEVLLPLYNRAMELELRFFEQYFPMDRAFSTNTSPASSVRFPISIKLYIDPTSLTEAEKKSSLHAIDGIGIDFISSLPPGGHRLMVNYTDGEISLKVQDFTEDAEKEDSPPLLSTLLGAASSLVVAQSTMELLTFLRALGARGSFEAYSFPPAELVRRVPRVLTIAGSDSGGGAGVQADMKACTNLGVFSTSAITAVTVQNTQGVHGIHAIPSNEISDQITCVLDDIGADVVKTGMLATEEIIDLVAKALENRNIPLVVDPVMVATSGHRLLKEAAHQTMVQRLFPLATIITPNIPETSALLNDRVIESIEDMQQAGRDLAAFGPTFVLVKGGHLKNPPNDQVHDVLLDAKRDEILIIKNPKLSTRNTHGTGCTLAAAIAAQYAKSGDMVHAVRSAIAYLHGILQDSQTLTIGKGSNGPMLHVA